MHRRSNNTILQRHQKLTGKKTRQVTLVANGTTAYTAEFSLNGVQHK